MSGVWRLEAGGQRRQVVFEQKFQHITGSVEMGQKKVGLRHARLRGKEIWFSLVDDAGVRHDFSGRVNGKHMSGTVKPDNGPAAPFSARW